MSRTKRKQNKKEERINKIIQFFQNATIILTFLEILINLIEKISNMLG